MKQEKKLWSIGILILYPTPFKITPFRPNFGSHVNECVILLLANKQLSTNKDSDSIYSTPTSSWISSPTCATMGLFDKLASMLKVRKEQVNILVVGLNNSGKSTIVNHFKDADEKSSIIVPTVGFNVERFQSK